MDIEKLPRRCKIFLNCLYDLELIPKLDLMNRKELAPNDDGTSKMNEGKIVVSLLFIAHEKFSKTVHVRMKQLDDPSGFSRANQSTGVPVLGL